MFLAIAFLSGFAIAWIVTALVLCTTLATVGLVSALLPPWVPPLLPYRILGAPFLISRQLGCMGGRVMAAGQLVGLVDRAAQAGDVG